MSLDLNTMHNQRMPKFDRSSFTEIDVLSFLINQPWNELALSYVSTLRPSSIRFSRGEVFCDSHAWRVTVTLDSHDIIVGITQEVEVGLSGDIQHGHALRCALHKQLNLNKEV